MTHSIWSGIDDGSGGREDQPERGGSTGRSVAKAVRVAVWCCFLLYCFAFAVAVLSARNRFAATDAQIALATLLERLFFYVFAVCFALDRCLS